eukprot:TRINITY_DN1513_c0_g1_i1.p1 TRINITY_DN1513_c0_g1~~TRINITY_DN1513_c0_g1_i1.p1  ORF type:complete len:53 (+),score=5.32 TRINITY_DN1513_c0_g1_i1:166-324(+)
MRVTDQPTNQPTDPPSHTQANRTKPKYYMTNTKKPDQIKPNQTKLADQAKPN